MNRVEKVYADIRSGGSLRAQDIVEIRSTWQRVGEERARIALIRCIEARNELVLESAQTVIDARSRDVLGAPCALRIRPTSTDTAISVCKIASRDVKRAIVGARKLIAAVDGGVLEIARIDTNPRVVRQREPRRCLMIEARGHDIDVAAIPIGVVAEEIGTRDTVFADRHRTTRHRIDG